MYKKSRLFLVALSSRFYYNFGFLHCKQCFVLINMLLDPKYVSLLILKAYFGNLSPLKLVRGIQHLSCVSWIACHLLYIHNISIINYVFGIPNIILINPLLYICLYSFATVSQLSILYLLLLNIYLENFWPWILSNPLDTGLLLSGWISTVSPKQPWGHIVCLVMFIIGPYCLSNEFGDIIVSILLVLISENTRKYM